MYSLNLSLNLISPLLPYYLFLNLNLNLNPHFPTTFQASNGLSVLIISAPALNQVWYN